MTTGIFVRLGKAYKVGQCTYIIQVKSFEGITVSKGVSERSRGTSTHVQCVAVYFLYEEMVIGRASLSNTVSMVNTVQAWYVYPLKQLVRLLQFS